MQEPASSKPYSPAQFDVILPSDPSIGAACCAVIMSNTGPCEVSGRAFKVDDAGHVGVEVIAGPCPGLHTVPAHSVRIFPTWPRELHKSVASVRPHRSS